MIQKLDLSDSVQEQFEAHYPEIPPPSKGIHTALSLLALKINEIIDVLNKEEE